MSAKNRKPPCRTELEQQDTDRKQDVTLQVRIEQ